MFIQNGSSAKPLQRDLKDDTLRVLMKLLVSSTEYDDVLLSLRGRLAGRALELLQDVSSLTNLPRCYTHLNQAILNFETSSTDAAIILPPNEVRRRLRVLLGQVAQLSDRIPPSLFVDGVKWNSEVISRTKFSDVTSGTFKKERVVIKRVKLPIKNVATDSSQQTKVCFVECSWQSVKFKHLVIEVPPPGARLEDAQARVPASVHRCRRQEARQR